MFDEYDRRKLEQAQKLLTEVYEYNYGGPRMGKHVRRLGTVIDKLKALQELNMEEQEK